jgi:hypothetical protein
MGRDRCLSKSLLYEPPLSGSIDEGLRNRTVKRSILDTAEVNGSMMEANMAKAKESGSGLAKEVAQLKREVADLRQQNQTLPARPEDQLMRQAMQGQSRRDAAALAEAIARSEKEAKRKEMEALDLNNVTNIEAGELGVRVTHRGGAMEFVEGDNGHKLYRRWLKWKEAAE